MASKHPYFSQPGWLPFIATSCVGVGVWHAANFFWSLPFWLSCGILVFLYRDPVRLVPSLPLAVISPADGRVSAVGVVADPYLDRQARCIVIDMHPLGVSITRSPMEGKIMDIKQYRHEEGHSHPHGVWLCSDESDDVVFVMGRGFLNALPHCDYRIGEKTGQGQRCGYIRLGGRVEVYLPETTRVSVKQGDRVIAGSDVVATLMHRY